MFRRAQQEYKKEAQVYSKYKPIPPYNQKRLISPQIYKMKKIYFFTLAALLLLSACAKVDNKFVLVNKTAFPISYYLSDSEQTTAIKHFSKAFYLPNDTVDYALTAPGAKRAIGMLGAWDDYLKYETAYIYIIDSADLGKDSTVLRNEHLIKGYRLTLAYMKEHNWEFEIK